MPPPPRKERGTRRRVPAAMRLLRPVKVAGRRHTRRSVLLQVLMRPTRRVSTRRRALVAVYLIPIMQLPIMLLRVTRRTRTHTLRTVLRVITRPRTLRITRPSTILSYSQIQAPLRRYTTTIQVARSLRQRCSRTDIWHGTLIRITSARTTEDGKCASLRRAVFAGERGRCCRPLRLTWSSWSSW